MKMKRKIRKQEINKVGDRDKKTMLDNTADRTAVVTGFDKRTTVTRQ